MIKIINLLSLAAFLCMLEPNTFEVLYCRLFLYSKKHVEKYTRFDKWVIKRVTEHRPLNYTWMVTRTSVGLLLLLVSIILGFINF